MEQRFFDDNSQTTLTVDFDWASVDMDAVAMQMENQFDLALEAQRKVWAWVYQPPCKDLDGFLCRCIVVTWVFVPQLRSYSITDIAGRFGKKKQSIDRWVADFKKVFPEITDHLQHLRHDQP